MPKSKYPSQIDTSVELPTVRDNITEIGSDALNSFKSAILAIEKTLGVNPQGSAGNTVSSRIDTALDSDGNIRSSAITQAGLISGPITNVEVADTAAISERKLDLTFPTQLLQDQISMVQSDITSFNDALRELATKLSIHVTPGALNAHSAVSISVSSATSVASDIAALDLEADTLQNVIEELYNSHINYSGLNISATNNSHFANQIYFDNENIQSITSANDVQEVIEELANLSGESFQSSLLNLHSDGLIRTGNIEDLFEGLDQPNRLIQSSDISYTKVDGLSRTTLNFTSTPLPTGTISAFDIVVLSGSTEETDNTSYNISEVSLDGSGNLSSVEIFGGPKIEDPTGITAEIFQNQYKVYNPAGLLSTVRPRANKTNTPDVQIANPNSATIISSGLTPEAITSTANTFDITIDGGSSVTIETYDSSLLTQTLDSIVNKINEQAVDNKYNFMAYKYRANNCYELALVHNIPNFSSDATNRTIQIDVGSTNDGSTELGLSGSIGEEIEGTSGNSLFLNGKVNNSFGKIKIYDGGSIQTVPGTGGLALATGTFGQEEIRIGDLLYIEGAIDSADDGIYRISSTNEDAAEIDGAYNFVDLLDENTLIIALRATSPIGELTFEETVSGSASILFDTFIDDNLDLFYSKRLEVDGEINQAGFVGGISDISKNFITAGETGSITFSTDGTAYITGPDGNPGESVYVSSPGDYKLFASDGFSFIILRISTSSPPSTSFSINLFGFDEIQRGSYLLSRGVFSNTLGRILGYPEEVGIPIIVDKRITGTVDETIVSESLLEKYIEGPRNDLRSSGIIRGLGISNVQLFTGYQTFDVDAGVAVVNGIRIEYPGKIGARINSENDFYVALDAFGCVITGESVINPDGYTIDNQGRLSPFYDNVVAHLASVESTVVYDLRLFIDRVDYKIVKEILVSNEKHFGHFTDINSAVQYARRFSEMFPDAGTPMVHIKEGLFEVDSYILVDFDVVIKGSGPSTVITKTGSLAVGDDLVSSEPYPLETVFYIGNLVDGSSEDILSGVTIKDLTYRVSDLIVSAGSFINLAEAKEVGKSKVFRFENISAEGPDAIAYNSGVDADVVGEYFIVVGFADTATVAAAAGTHGNIFVRNCYMSQMGIEQGACKFRDSASITYEGIVVSGNIGEDLSPNEGLTVDIFETPVNPTLTEVVEVANVIV